MVASHPQPAIEARPYQQRTVDKALGMFAGTFQDRNGRLHPPAHSVLIESPTGSGKTVMGLLVAAEMQRKHGYRIGWVAMRRNLLAQAAAENISRGFNLKLDLISMFDKAPPQVDMVVVDEAQHDAARSMAILHERVKPKHVLGLSATPYRTDRIKLCFQQVIRDVGIQRLIQEGYLAPYHHYTIPEYNPRSVAECYCREQDRWEKSLLFFHRYRDCLQCRDELLSRGVQAEIVTAASDRERQIDRFAAGTTHVLISMAILAEGFDCPSLKTVFCRPSGKSCTIQMSGRVFRRYPGIEFKQIVQCRATRHPLLKTAEPHEQYAWMDGGWRTLKLNRRLAEVSAHTLRLVAASPVALPEVVAQHRPGSPRLRRMRRL